MSRTISKFMRAPYSVPNGLQVTDEGLWIVDQFTDRMALVEMLDIRDGAMLDRIDISPEHPEPHGLTRLGEDLLYCDATSGWVVRVSLS